MVRFIQFMVVSSLFRLCLCTSRDRSLFISNLAQLEFFKLAKDNFVESGMEIDSPDVKDFFEEQAEIYVRDWILRFEAGVQYTGTQILNSTIPGLHNLF